MVDSDLEFNVNEMIGISAVGWQEKWVAYEDHAGNREVG